MGSNSIFNTKSIWKQTLSDKYYTVYPYDSSSESNTNNWTVYNGLKSSTYGYGDAILETSSSGSNSNSWYSDFSTFVNTSSPYFIRGGFYFNGKSAGAFSTSAMSGEPNGANGFRVVLCP